MLVAAVGLIPAAIAWACNPQAHISLDRTSYSPGQSITVFGSYFPGSTATNPVVITVSGPVDSTQARTSAGGGFTATLTAPSTAGAYTITASRPTGGFAAASFRVAAPVQQTQQPAASQDPPAQAQSQAPAESSAPSTTTTTQKVGTPKVQASDPGPSSGGGSTPGSRGGETTTTTTTTAPTTSAPAQPVFTGSVAPAQAETFSTTTTRTAATTPGRSRTAARGERASSRPSGAASPSQATALSDVWSAYQPGRTPSLMTEGGSAASGGTGSQLAWGIGLLAVGLFALVGGLAYTEARRRRPA